MKIVPVLSIGSFEDINGLYEKMEVEIDLLAKEGIQLEIDVDQKGSIQLLICNLIENQEYKKDSKDALNIFYHYIANVVADYIIHSKEAKILEKIIKQEYYYFNPKERKNILELSIKALNEREGFYLSTSIYQISKKVRIIDKIVNYLENHNKLIIDGFVIFRLKGYIEDLKEAVEAGIEDFMMEKEYNEFIRLLQYFVDVQEPQIQTLHIIVNDHEDYSLLDSNYKLIQNEYLEELSTEFLDGEIKYEDLLISSLITMAPSKIYIHYMDKCNNREIIETIEKVFGNRVIVCDGCEICKKQTLAKKE